MLDYEEGTAAVGGDELQAELREINANANLSEQYLALARDLDVMEPKAPDEVPPDWLRSTMFRVVPAQ